MDPTPQWLLVVVLIASVSTALQLILAACALRLLSRSAPPGPTPPITIFKPLKGLDEGLYENLVSLLRQDYPEFELILGVADPRDPALVVAHQLKREFSKARVRIVVGAPDRHGNPKVANLLSMSAAARYEWWLISDANVRVDPDYLTSIAAHADDPRVGLVTNLVVGRGSKTLGAQLENLQLNATILPSVAGAYLVANRACVVGKSMLLRRGALESIGGLERALPYLAEDYLLGRWLENAGFRVAVSGYPVATINGKWSVRRFLSRHLRWNQLRRRVLPWVFAGEILINPSALWLIVLVATGFGGPLSWLALAAMTARYGGDILILARLRTPITFLTPLLLMVKDATQLALWLTTWCTQTVHWRGQSLRLGPLSYIESFAPLGLSRRRASIAAGPALVRRLAVEDEQ